MITIKSGSEFTSEAMCCWPQGTGVKLGLILPGKPTENAFVECLGGKFRSKCLYKHWFRFSEEARSTVDEWPNHCNHKRPHSPLG